MTDLFVDLAHLTSLAGRFDDAAVRLGAPSDVAGALGVTVIDRAWSGFRQRRRDGMGRLSADVGRAADGLARVRDAYAAAETAIERGFAP